MSETDTMQSSASTATTRTRRISGGKIVSGIALVVVILGMGLLITQAPFNVNGGAMVPTFFEGQRLLCYKFSYSFSPPQRGDIVVYSYPKDPQFDFVHRVIGLPGETVTVRNERVYINDTRLDEPYLQGFPTACLAGSECSDEPVVVPDGHIFVMADNRSNAIDARNYGPVSLNLVKGRVWMVYAPQEDFRLVQRLTYDL